jgi:hypothetical protein
MKVIFLDHDGVTCLANNWGSRFKKKDRSKYTSEIEMPVEFRFDNFDKKAIKVLNEILEETGAEIVVSSDWRLYCNLEEMGEYYENHGICKKPIGFTKRMTDFDSDGAALFTWKGWNERIRIVEIQEWVKNHPEITSWVAVDDMNMHELESFVHTPNSNEGIKQSSKKEQIIKALNSK